MAKVQYTGYAKDKRYRPKQLPVDMILSRQKQRDDDLIQQMASQADSSIEEGQRLLQANKENQRITEGIRQSNERLEDTYRANSKEALIRRRDTEVAYYKAEAAAIEEQGRLLGGLAKSVGDTIAGLQAQQKQADLSNALSAQLQGDSYITEFAQKHQLDNGNFSQKNWDKVIAGLTKIQEREKKLLETANDQAAQQEVVKKIGDELVAAQEQAKKDRDERIKKKGYYKSRDRLNEVTSNLYLMLDEQSGGIRYLNKNAKLALAEANMINDYDSVLQHLQKSGIAHITYDGLTRVAAGIVQRHYGLENVHTPTAVKLKKQLIKQRGRSKFQRFQSSNKAFVRIALDRSRDRIAAAAKVFADTGDATALWREVDHLSGEGSSVWNPETNSTFSAKDAIFGTKYSVWDVLNSIDPNLAKKFEQTQPRRYNKLDKSKTIQGKYSDLSAYKDQLAFDTAESEQDRAKHRSAGEAREQKLAIHAQLTVRPGDEGYGGSLRKRLDDAENGTIVDRQNIRASLHAWVETNVHEDSQPYAKKIIWEVSGKRYREFAPTDVQAELARKDGDHNELYKIINNPALDDETAKRLQKKYQPYLKIIEKAEMKKWSIDLSKSGLKLHAVPGVNYDEAATVKKTANELRADLSVAINKVMKSGKYKADDYAGILAEAKDIVERDHAAGVSNSVWSKYNVTRSTGSSGSFYTHQKNSNLGGQSKVTIAKLIHHNKGNFLNELRSGKFILFDVDTVQQQGNDHVTEELINGEKVLTYHEVELSPNQEFAYLTAYPNGVDPRTGAIVSRTDFLAAIHEGTEKYIKTRTGLDLTKENVGALDLDPVVRRQDENLGQREWVRASDLSNFIKKSTLTKSKTVKEVSLNQAAITAKNEGLNLVNPDVDNIRKASTLGDWRLSTLSDPVNNVLGAYYITQPNAIRLTEADIKPKGGSLIKGRSSVLELNDTEASQGFIEWAEGDASDAYISKCTTEDLRSTIEFCYKVK